MRKTPSAAANGIGRIKTGKVATRVVAGGIGKTGAARMVGITAAVEATMAVAVDLASTSAAVARVTAISNRPLTTIHPRRRTTLRRNLIMRNPTIRPHGATTGLNS